MAISLIGGVAGAGVGAIQSAIGKAQRTASDVVRFATTLDMSILIKYTIQILVLLTLLILAIQGLRGLFIGAEQVTCGITHAFGGSEVCSPTHPLTEIASVNWAWDVEWYLLCIWYLGLATIMGIIAWEWIKRVMDLLVNIDKFFAKMDDWIYGRKRMFSDEALA